MDTNHIQHYKYYTPLPENHHSPANLRRSFKPFKVIIVSSIFLLSLVGLIIFNNQNNQTHPQQVIKTPLPRGVEEGVSAKSYQSPFGHKLSYNWTNAMLSWQRTSFHFQPEKNWMNDPDGPLYHMGWYHLFYQYNPDSAVWGNITWGHAVSKDLIHWLYLPLAMVPDQPYDINGVWTGSATFLPNRQIAMLYTGSTAESVQVQNLAYPANTSDPLLLDWIKYPGNPVLVPPEHIEYNEFRDPTTGWLGPDGKWRIAIGSKINDTGITLIYYTTDFTSYELSDNLLHAVPGTGMWECVDFFPVAVNGSTGLDTSAGGPGIKHVLKASMDDTKIDYYAIGSYDRESDTWTPDYPDLDVGIGLRYDYGKFYASKSFYDQFKKRRILWGWIDETDTESDDLAKGWASVQAIPRTLLYDNKTGTNVLQWPVEEVESLRRTSSEFKDVLLVPGSVVPLDVGPANQLDIIAEFEVESLEPEGGEDEEVNGLSSCDSAGGSTKRTKMGPFGLLVIADESLSELTPVYFRPINSTTTGASETYFCTDQTRSTLAPLEFDHIYGSTVPVLEGEKYEMRVLVDHSIVESFAQGGRRVITSRIYPTEAIYGSTRLFLFNNATGVNVKASLKVWQMTSAFIRPFPL